MRLSDAAAARQASAGPGAGPASIKQLTIVIPTAGEPTARTPGYWEHILTAIERLGPRVEVLEPRMRAAWRKHRNADRYVSALWLPPLTLLRDVRRTRSEVIICVEYGPATLAAIAAAAFRPRKRVFIFQEHQGRAGAELSFAIRLYRRALGRLACGVIANTESARNELLGGLGLSPRKITMVPLLLPPERDAMLEGSAPVAGPTFRPLFLFVGQLIPRKNVAGLLEAAHELHEDGFAFEIWLVGMGPDREELERRRDQLGLGQTLRFLGRIEHRSLGHLYAACDAFVLPSFSEYRSIAVLEALRFGRAVIDSTLDGHAGDLVRDEVNGLVFDPRKPGDLARCMRRFISDPALAARFGERSAELVDPLSITRSAEMLLDAVSRPGWETPHGLG